MSDQQNKIEYSRALEDFRRARAKARVQHLWSTLTGQSKELLQYDEISSKMHVAGGASKGVQDISVDAIVGSVNRYQDFDKNFLPLHDSDMERWANVKTTMTSPGSPGLPPIRVYKLGDAYFVLDGNHRVSIAKEMGIEKIEAYVTEIKTKVPLSADDSPEDIILKAEYVEFLEETHFDKAVPGVDLELTFPGLYDILEEHIRVHRHYMGIEQWREIPQEEAARHWYDHVYQPVVNIIRQQNILSEFPQRTETDLYIWVLDHQTYLERELGWTVRPEKAASDFVNKHSRRLISVLRRWWNKIIKFILPGSLEDFSSPGEWHKHKGEEEQYLFSDILVAFDASPESWIAIEQAIFLAEMEKSAVRGLVVRNWLFPHDFDEAGLSQAFSERLLHSGLEGNLAYAEGKIAETITTRAQYNDLVVLKLKYAPSNSIFARLSSGIRKILRKSSRPIFFIRDITSNMDHILLAYDGSPKGKEALFVSAYFASRYHKRLTLLVVDKDEEKGKKLLGEAQSYLGGICVKAVHKASTNRTSKVILDMADEVDANVIMMGGYGRSPLMEALFSSSVDGVLRGTHIPVLVCQ